MENYDHFQNIKLQYTKPEQSVISDYETVVNDLVQEYTLKFIVGQLDPSSDSDWNGFTQALQKGGLGPCSAN